MTDILDATSANAIFTLGGNILLESSFIRMKGRMGPLGPSISTAIQDASAPSVADEALVGLLRSGELSAGEQLARRYYQPLMRYLQRLTGHDYLAEDLHQQTWLSVLDHLDKFDAGAAGGFKAWLFRIATNKAHDFWRSHGRWRNAHQGLRLVSESESPAADQEPSRIEEQARLRLAIEQLPELQRQVVMLRYYSGLKFTEIAQALGCPLNTALGRMHKAVCRLRQLMEVEVGNG